MFQSRAFTLALVGVIAISSTTTDTILTILEAASISATQKSILHVAAASSTLDVVSVCCIGLYTYQSVRPRSASAQSTIQKRILTAVCISLCGTALTVSLALLILIKSRWEEVQTSSKGPVSDWTAHVAAQIGLWVISCASQIVLYTSAFWSPKAPKLHAISTSGPRDSIMSELRSNLFLMKSDQPSSLAVTIHSPTYSVGSSQSLKSFRESVRHVVRPATSRTTLIGRTSLTRDASIYSQTESFDNVSHCDGFDTWDTSGVSMQARDAVMQSVSSRRIALDPIPGSRPTTPALPLEGPFHTEHSEDDIVELTPPPRMTHDHSRPSSPANSEGHIHPLFRSESPVPPPEATPGTIILASPLATQAITCPAKSFNRMRSETHLSQARSTRGRTSSPHRSSRTPSPVSREMTPPIPDYVLNSSPRSSRSFSGARRVPLQFSPDR